MTKKETMLISRTIDEVIESVTGKDDTRYMISDHIRAFLDSFFRKVS